MKNIEAERCEVASVELAKRGNNEKVIAFTLRFPDLSTEEFFIPLSNAHRMQGDINHFLQIVKFKPPVLGNNGLSKFVNKKEKK